MAIMTNFETIYISSLNSHDSWKVLGSFEKIIFWIFQQHRSGLPDNLSLSESERVQQQWLCFKSHIFHLSFSKFLRLPCLWKIVEEISAGILMLKRAYVLIFFYLVMLRDALRDLVPLQDLKSVKNTHGVLLLVKF